jgi:predicted nucleotidyltransferase
LIDVIQSRSRELADVCKRYGVERLYVFGSAATGQFELESSDLDFIVELAGREPTGAYADRYFGLVQELERLFGRKVDLITAESVRNPYFKREVDSTRQLVYAKPVEEAPV